MRWRGVPVCHHGLIAHLCRLHAARACRPPLITPLSSLFEAGKSCPIPLALSTTPMDFPSLPAPWCKPGRAAAHSCHLSLHLFQFPLVREGLEQMQSSRCEQPQVYTAAPRGSPVPLQHCTCIAGQKSAQKSPRWPRELLPEL